MSQFRNSVASYRLNSHAGNNGCRRIHREVLSMKKLSAVTLRSMVVSAALAALGIVVPIAFHAVGLGSRFMPMILVVMLCGFVLPLGWAAFTGAIVPVVSCLLTGMPPLYPPFFLIMSIELALTSAAVSLVFSRTVPRIWPALLSGILLDRVISTVLTYYLAGWFGLPPWLFTFAQFAQSLPGIALQLMVVPLVVRAIQGREGILFSHGKPPETPILQ